MQISHSITLCVCMCYGCSYVLYMNVCVFDALSYRAHWSPVSSSFKTLAMWTNRTSVVEVHCTMPLFWATQGVYHHMAPLVRQFIHSNDLIVMLPTILINYGNDVSCRWLANTTDVVLLGWSFANNSHLLVTV